MAGAVYVDADACPVKAETIRVATRHNCQVFIVSNGGIRPDPDPLVQTIIVAAGPDMADKWIAENAGQGDVVVTADIPLAAKVLANGALALAHDGTNFTEQNIGARLATRDLMADLRAADPLMTGAGRGGGRGFSKQDRSRFLDRLEALLRILARG